MSDKTCIQIAEEIISGAIINQIKAAEELLNDANEIVPVVTGNLKDSGRVESNGNSVKVIYDADYAMYVHENPNGRGYKWLENTMINNMDKYIQIIGGEDE